MRASIPFVPMLFIAAILTFVSKEANAQIDVLWQAPRINNESIFLGAANMDGDPNDELVYYKPSSSPSIMILDAATGAVDWQSGSFVAILIAGQSNFSYGFQPFCVIDGSGRRGLTFIGQQTPGDPYEVYLVGTGGSANTASPLAISQIRPRLGQNYPNPFRPSTTIRFSVPTESSVRIEIFNVQGQRVRTLLQDTLGAGEHSVEWDGRNDAVARVASGTYFYRLTVGDQTFAKKAVVLK